MREVEILKKKQLKYTKYYLRFWLSSCRTSLAVSALRIMRYCPKNDRQFFFTVKERFHHGLIIYDILILIGKTKSKNN